MDAKDLLKTHTKKDSGKNVRLTGGIGTVAGSAFKRLGGHLEESVQRSALAVGGCVAG